MLGIPRFASTSMIPAMEQGVDLTPDVAGWLAVRNWNFNQGTLSVGVIMLNVLLKRLPDLQVK